MLRRAPRNDQDPPADGEETCAGGIACARYFAAPSRLRASIQRSARPPWRDVPARRRAARPGSSLNRVRHLRGERCVAVDHRIKNRLRLQIMRKPANTDGHRQRIATAGLSAGRHAPGLRKRDALRSNTRAASACASASAPPVTDRRNAGFVAERFSEAIMPASLALQSRLAGSSVIAHPRNQRDRKSARTGPRARAGARTALEQRQIWIAGAPAISPLAHRRCRKERIVWVTPCRIRSKNCLRAARPSPRSASPSSPPAIPSGTAPAAA